MRKQMTIIHEIKNVNAMNSFIGDQESLNLESDSKCLKGIDEIWYYYFGGGYEGSGVALLRKGLLYTDCSLSHCSCCSPEDNIDNITDASYIPLNELKSRLSKELDDDLKPIFDFMENKNVN